MRDILGYYPHSFSFYSYPKPSYHYNLENHRCAVHDWAMRLVYDVDIGVRDPITFELKKHYYESQLFVNLERSVAIARGA